MDLKRGLVLYTRCKSTSFFYCNSFASNDVFRPKWRASKANIQFSETVFAGWLNSDQPFVIFDFGTILIEDPATKIGAFRCQTTLPSLVNVLPSIAVNPIGDQFVVEFFGFLYSIVSAGEVDEHVQSLLKSDSVFGEGVCESINIPSDPFQRAVATLAWNRLLHDIRHPNIVLTHIPAK